MSEVRLIDANELEKIVRDDIRIYDSNRTYNPFNQMKRDSLVELAERIERAPTVDAVPVCRCGRCEYYSNEMNCCLYVNGLHNVTKTDYCSYGRCADGERRSE